MSNELVALVTCPPEKAEEIAEALVESKLAACVNIVAGITSIYRWQGQINKDPEFLLIIKTSRKVYDALEKKLKEVHPYDVPELICLPIEAGSKAYLEWMNQSIECVG